MKLCDKLQGLFTCVLTSLLVVSSASRADMDGDSEPPAIAVVDGQNRKQRSVPLNRSQAVATALKWARTKLIDVDAYRVDASLSDRVWTVHLTPIEQDTFGGDLTIVLDRETGEVLGGSRGQ